MWSFMKKFLGQILDGVTRTAELELLFTQFNNYIITVAGLVTSAATVKTGGSPMIVMVGGQNVIVAAASSFPALTGLNLANGQTGCALFGMDQSGALYTWIGPAIIASAVNLAGLVWPVPSENNIGFPYPVVVGGVILQDVSAGAFTGGTTSLATAGLTVTYFNCGPGQVDLPVTFR